MRAWPARYRLVCHAGVARSIAPMVRSIPSPPASLRSGHGPLSPNRPDWLPDPEHWQGMARLVEDKLSDALHERLASRFVDRRTSVLTMRRLRENAMLEAEVTAAGRCARRGPACWDAAGLPLHGGAEGWRGRGQGPEPGGDEGAWRRDQVVGGARRAARATMPSCSRMTGWCAGSASPSRGWPRGEKVLEPRLRLLVEGASHRSCARAGRGPAQSLAEEPHHAPARRAAGAEAAENVTGIARGIAYQAAGVARRAGTLKVGEEMKALEQDGRAALRQLGIRFGAFTSICRRC